MAWRLLASWAAAACQTTTLFAYSCAPNITTLAAGEGEAEVRLVQRREAVVLVPGLAPGLEWDELWTAPIKTANGGSGSADDGGSTASKAGSGSRKGKKGGCGGKGSECAEAASTSQQSSQTAAAVAGEAGNVQLWRPFRPRA